MTPEFIFNQDVVLYMLLIVVAVVCAFVVAGFLAFYLIDLIERDCRNDVRFDDTGRKNI